MAKLGVNIDHVATIREARKTYEPDPVIAAGLCEKAGCDSIVCHLREDRRHIKDRDVARLKQAVRTRFNLEMSVDRGIVDIACRIRPDQATLVPERREEITTEGGLDVKSNISRIAAVIAKLRSSGIDVSLFINPSRSQILASKKAGADLIEIHTGEYANADTAKKRNIQLRRTIDAAQYAMELGLEVNAGHGLNYENVRPIAKIPGINELNIGHSIISRAVFVGIEAAVREMAELIR